MKKPQLVDLCDLVVCALLAAEMITCDILIVGAGFSGLVLAERLSSKFGKTCIIIDRRPHIGGNAYDEFDPAGVLIHKYGPHYFRTNSTKVIQYLSNFTEWHNVFYNIKSYTHGRYWSFPINLNTFEEILGRPSSPEEMAAYLAKVRIPIHHPNNSEEIIISQVGYKLYEMFFKKYTLKQWRIHPRDLDISVCGRIPIRTNRDERYLSESFQALPKYGYTEMFNTMIDNMKDCEVWLNTDFSDIRNKVSYSYLVYTGPIDEFYDYRFGELPYRSLRFEPESFNAIQLLSRLPISQKPGFWQPAVQVNYPNEEEFTRIVEIKHVTGQTTEATTIIREYPEDYELGKDPYYPVPTAHALDLYGKYQKLAKKEKNVTFIGRLATYQYYNMDQVVEIALDEAERIDNSV